MRIGWLSWTCAAALGLASHAEGTEPLNLSVLYAGHPGSARERDFLTFLRGQVRNAAATDYRTFTADRARGFDVILFDWTSIYPRDQEGRVAADAGGLDIPAPPALSMDFDRPAVLIGQAGGSVAEALGLKATGLCLCLEDAAHDMVPAHEILQGPRQVDLRSDERPLPAQYRPERASDPGAIPLLAGLGLIVASLLSLGVRLVLSGPGSVGPRGVDVGRRRDPVMIGLFIALTAGILTAGAGGAVARLGGGPPRAPLKVWTIQTRTFPATDPGLVYDPYGFEDSPDAEFIASGLNGKDPHALALGRQANFFLWGFSASPAEMTPGGRALFLNALCYIRKFDGDRPLVYRKQRSREWALVHARQVERSGYEATQARRLFPTALRARFADDAASYATYYEENLEYLHPAPVGFEVDEDVKTLGVSNRRIELLDRCVSMLERGDRIDVAARILGRYTTVDQVSPEAWRGWLETNRDHLFFTDVGGFTFSTDPGAPPGAAPLADRADGGPRGGRAVWARAELVPAKVRPDGSPDLVIRVHVAPGWHIYAANGSKGPGMPTTLELKLPDGLRTEGGWIIPEPKLGPDGQATYEGEIEFRRHLRADPAAAGVIEVTCELAYQECDRFSCRAPTEVRLEATAVVVSGGNR